MKQRIMIGVTLAALSCTPAFAQSTSGQSTRSTTSNPQTVQSYFKTISGEWDGQVITTNGGKTSSSQVNASNRIENNGGQFASCFQGFSFGQPFQGGSVFNCENTKFSFASNDSINNEPSRGTFTGTNNGWVCTFERTDAKTGKTTKFEHVTTIVNNDNYTVECFSFDSNGKKHEVMVMDMTRLPSGQNSPAAASFTSSPALAKARQTLANSAQATADDTK